MGAFKFESVSENTADGNVKKAKVWRFGEVLPDRACSWR